MKPVLLLISVVLVLSGCTATYKSGQTPDDVYFSPVRQQEEYARVENDDERKYRGEDRSDYKEDDRYLRMKVRDRQRWEYLDDYYRDPYAYKYNRYYTYDNCYCNPNQYWNRYYNPYYSNNDIYISAKSPVYNKPRRYNLHVFDAPENNTYNPKAPSTRSRSYDRPSDSRSRGNTGNDMRDIFRNSESARSGSTNNSNTQSRTTERKSTETKSSSGSTNAPARRN